MAVGFLSSCKGEVKPVDTPSSNPTEKTKDSVSKSPLAKIEELIIASPNSEEGYYKRANYYYQTNDPESAFKDINRALKIAPSNPNVNLLKGQIYVKLNKLELGIPFLERAVELDSLHTNANLELAYYYLAGKNYEPSLNLINRIIQKDKFLSRPYYLKGMWYEQQGRNELAISSYQTAIERNPNYYEAYLALGALHDKMDNPLAIQYFNSALTIYPNRSDKQVEAWRLKGMSYYEHEEYEEAIICFDTILSYDPTFYVAHYDIGSSLLKMCYKENSKQKNDSLVQEAFVQFEQALKQNVNYIDAIYNRAVCYEEMGNVSKAKSEYKRILELEVNYEPAIEALNRLDK